MARNIENAQDLKDVLDAIYNNSSQYDTYQNLTLYYNDITRTATIFTVDEEDEENTKNVIAVFNPENVVTQDNAFFVTLMKSATVNVSTEETSVYDFALGAYVSVDTLLKNICVALGVSLSGTFADANPSLYSDMINIIRNEYGQALENNAPYIMKKFVNLDTQEESYKSLVPLMCIVRIAIYLNNLGIFNAGDFEVITPTPVSREYFYNVVSPSTSNMVPYFNTLITKTLVDLPVTDTHFSLKSKNKFKEDIKKWLYEDNGINWLGNSYITPQPLVSDPNNLNAVDKIFDLYETDIDWDNDIVKMVFLRTSDTQHRIRFFVMPKDKSINTVFNNAETSTYNASYDIGGTCKARSTVYGMRTAIEDNTPYTTFDVTVKLNTTTQEIEVTNSKTVNAINKGIYDTSFSSNNIMMDNIRPDGYIKPYTKDERPYTSSTARSSFYYIDRYTGLTMNTEYDAREIKLLDNDKRHYYIDYITDEVLKKNNYDLNIGTNDMVVMFRLQPNINSTTTYKIIKIVVFRDIETFTLTGTSANSRMANPFQYSLQHGFTKYLSNKEIYNSVEYDMAIALPAIYTDYASVNSQIRENTNPNASITFDSAKTIDVYTVDYRDIENDNLVVDYQTNSADSLIFKDLVPSDIETTWALMCLSNNIGEWVDYSEDSGIEGINLIEGATYPKNVFDLNSFNEIYPSWWKTQSNNPQIVDGVLAPTVTSTTWGAVAISQTTPQTQEDADSGEIDFTDTDIIDNIIDDIDNANEDNDIDTSATTEGDDNNGGSDEGNTPEIPSDSSLPLLAGSRVYAMTYGQVQGLVASMANPDMWELIAGGDVTRYIVSLQANQCWDGNGTQKAVVVGNLEAQYESEGQTYSVNGTEISGVDLYSNFNFGYADVPYKFNNYLDITNSKLTIYLPYVGFVDLDISEFIGRKLGLKAKVYLPTGDLMYFISSLDEESHTEQLKYIYTGNCSSEIPLSSNTSILNAFKNSINVGNVIGMVQDALGV